MANQFYGYNPSYGAAAAAAANLASAYPSRSVTDSFLSDSSRLSSSRYLSSDHLSSDPSYYSVTERHSSLLDGLRFSASDIGTSGAFSRIPGGVGASVDAGTSVDALAAGLKRSSEALYHPSVLGAHNTSGQSEAWFSTNSLAKRSRFESASNLPIYPQRPGEKDCAHYMLTRTCKFGDSCKFDHPIWVPEGGIPDWKEHKMIPSGAVTWYDISMSIHDTNLDFLKVPIIAANEFLPQRPGEPDCPYFMKTQKCKFGQKCKFNHPKDQGASENTDVSFLPERPSELPCAFYMKTGKCKFGATCKFHHPKDIQILSTGKNNADCDQAETGAMGAGTTDDVKLPVSVIPALLHNSKGLPVRLGEVDCPFYLKTGSCKYGATCRYNHPDRNAINPPAAAVGHALVASPATNLNFGVINPATSIVHPIDPRLSQTIGVGPTIYPQRPGQIECDFYMKTGECKFGERCKFHHPIDRSEPTTTMLQQNIKLTLAGFPRREGAIICPFYLKTGTCKYGITCKFDHPPPGEVMAMATSQGASASAGGEANGLGKDDESAHEEQ